MSEQFQIYIFEKKEIYEHILSYLENNDANDGDFLDLITFVNRKRIGQDRQEYEHFFLIIMNIANEHHCDQSFFTKILLLQLAAEIKQKSKDLFNSFKNQEIFLFIQKTCQTSDQII